MAQIIEKIVRSEYPPRDTRVLWIDTTDNSLKSFTSNGWNKISASTKVTELEAKIAELENIISQITIKEE